MTEALPEAVVPVPALHPTLSLRQQEILQKICDGKTIRDIALELYISENTVKYHLKMLFKLLQVHTRAMLVRVAIRQGLIH